MQQQAFDKYRFHFDNQFKFWLTKITFWIFNSWCTGLFSYVDIVAGHDKWRTLDWESSISSDLIIDRYHSNCSYVSFLLQFLQLILAYQSFNHDDKVRLQNIISRFIVSSVKIDGLTYNVLSKLRIQNIYISKEIIVSNIV